MPVSQTWTVAHSRSTRRAASASTAMTALAPIRSPTAFTISPLSTPVVPSTPAAKAATGRKEPKCSGAMSMRCRVTRVLSAAWGPTASGVMARFPSPTTSTSPSLGSRGAISFARAVTARGKAPSSRRSSPVRSRV